MASLYCSNPSCQAENALESRRCQNCSAPLLRPYLHVIGEGAANFASGTLIADRYLVMAEGFVIDTQPARLQPLPEEIPEFILPYLRLLPQQPHVPHVYGLTRQPSPLWLLAYGHFRHDLVLQAKVLPELESLWPEAGARRQLNWLWQIVRLWRPLRSQGVASALLEPSLLRVSGSLLQVLELPLGGHNIRLPQLVPLWSQWAETATPPVRELLQRICEGLSKGEIIKSRQLAEIFEQALSGIEQRGKPAYSVASHTSAGPKRHHNEDAYLQSGRYAGGTKQAATDVLAVVCDGIGGHDGGEVASRLAIEALRERLEVPLSAEEKLPPTIERAIFEANARICERNDREQRQARQRMGTTLSLAAIRDRFVYFAHVGDSRVYYLSPVGCFQMTLDDDVATRATRLGHTIYANALLQANAGSLVQALGMGSSKILHPTLRPFILAEECAILICSDGVSDYDRIEQSWEWGILPILEGQIAPEKASKQLVALADRENGHDNATVSLIHCQLPEDAGSDSMRLSEIFRNMPSASSLSGASELQKVPIRKKVSQQGTQRRQGPFRVALGAALLGAAAAALYWFVPTIRTRVNTFVESWIPTQLPDLNDDRR